MGDRDIVVEFLARLDSAEQVTCAPSAHELQEHVLTSTHGQFWSSGASREAIRSAQCAVCASRRKPDKNEVAFVLVSEGCSSWCAVCSDCAVWNTDPR